MFPPLLTLRQHVMSCTLWWAGAIIYWQHRALSHVEKPGSTVRIMLSARGESSSSKVTDFFVSKTDTSVTAAEGTLAFVRHAIHCPFWSISCCRLLPVGLRLCLSLSAPSSTACPCTDPGPNLLRTLPLPVPIGICVLVYGLPIRVPNPNSKVCPLLIPCLRVVRLDPQIILHSWQTCANHSLKCLQKRFENDKQYHKDYIAFIRETIACGDAEKVPEEEIDRRPALYLPHHGVYHAQKPRKIQVVFNCSAKFLCMSLTCLQDWNWQIPW